MALKNYNVVVNGTETILQLDDRDAKARGLTDKDLVGAESSAPDPDAEAAAAAEREAAEAAAKAEADKKAAAPANKSRTAANKEQ